MNDVDAPLSGGRDGNFWDRPLERFLRSYELPEGISVRAYAGLPHQPIMQAALDLPRFGQRRCTGPAKLIVRQRQLSLSLDPSAPHVVETHPALVMWLLLRDQFAPDAEIWRYKNVRQATCAERCTELWDALCSLRDWEFHRIPTPIQGSLKQLDDRLDAVVCYAMVKAWLEDASKAIRRVLLLGDEHCGAMLLPLTGDVFNEWKQYRARLPSAR